MPVDLVLRQARRAEAKEPLVDIATAGGRVVDIARHIVADAPAEELDGRLVIAGFVESHIHLDKARIHDRCGGERGTLEEAIGSVAAAKPAVTQPAIYARARHPLEPAVIISTSRLRT